MLIYTWIHTTINTTYKEKIIPKTNPRITKCPNGKRNGRWWYLIHLCSLSTWVFTIQCHFGCTCSRRVGYLIACTLYPPYVYESDQWKVLNSGFMSGLITTPYGTYQIFHLNRWSGFVPCPPVLSYVHLRRINKIRSSRHVFPVEPLHQLIIADLDPTLLMWIMMHESGAAPHPTTFIIPYFD